MTKQRVVRSRKLIRGTRAHALATYLTQTNVMYEYYPFLQIPLSRLYAGMHTKSDLDVIENYVREVKNTERKFEQIRERLDAIEALG